MFIQSNMLVTTICTLQSLSGLDRAFGRHNSLNKNTFQFRLGNPHIILAAKINLTFYKIRDPSWGFLEIVSTKICHLTSKGISIIKIRHTHSFFFKAEEVWLVQQVEPIHPHPSAVLSNPPLAVVLVSDSMYRAAFDCKSLGMIMFMIINGLVPGWHHVITTYWHLISNPQAWYYLHHSQSTGAMPRGHWNTDNLYTKSIQSTFQPQQNGHHFADGIFSWISLIEYFCIFIEI